MLHERLEAYRVANQGYLPNRIYIFYDDYVEYSLDVLTNHIRAQLHQTYQKLNKDDHVPKLTIIMSEGRSNIYVN
jgi:hypothetical protein